MSARLTLNTPRKPGNALVIYSRLLVYIKRYWLALLIASIGSMLYSAVDGWFVYFLKPLLNEGLVAKNYHFLRLAPWLVLVAFSVRGVAAFLSNYYIALASRNVILALRQDVF